MSHYRLWEQEQQQQGCFAYEALFIRPPPGRCGAGCPSSSGFFSHRFSAPCNCLFFSLPDANPCCKWNICNIGWFAYEASFCPRPAWIGDGVSNTTSCALFKQTSQNPNILLYIEIHSHNLFFVLSLIYQHMSGGKWWPRHIWCTDFIKAEKLKMATRFPVLLSNNNKKHERQKLRLK